MDKKRESGEYKVKQKDFVDLYLKKIDETRHIPHTTFTG
jgi:hypothetical protein